MATLKELVLEYKLVRERRAELERQAKELQTGREAEVKAAILAELAASGLTSANIAGVAKVVKKTTSHYEIQDTERLAEAMFRQMLAKKQAGFQFSDGLLLQARVKRDTLEALVGDTATDEALSAYGLLKVSRDDLSITKN